ncbi:hypothetical protein BN938_1260 [Mucinivorans hirudinis]|uniref:Uncharacterized protein n=1 Tax=Mucinivorans hirudinis TaxID=1433126 RepID=A0A060RC68_9BACT|nr:hypothetical protein BN938_1260 [Mucinivorans hirudinis]
MRNLFTLIFAIATAAVMAQKPGGLVQATYDTNYGKMTLAINLETRQVTGFYGGDGKILGTIDGNNRITGAWVQKEQGMLELDFSNDFKQFTGKFGVGNTLTSGVWKGNSLSVEHVTGDEVQSAVERNGVYDIEYNTDYGLMKLSIDFNTNKVTGSYGSGGQISGIINSSNRVAGEWGRVDKGRFEFDFTPDLKKFTGKWGEKNNTLTDGVWMGESINIKKR